MLDVSESNKIIARNVAEAFGPIPKITTMWDAENRSSVDVAAAVDSPRRGPHLVLDGQSS